MWEELLVESQGKLYYNLEGVLRVGYSWKNKALANFHDHVKRLLKNILLLNSSINKAAIQEMFGKTFYIKIIVELFYFTDCYINWFNYSSCVKTFMLD